MKITTAYKTNAKGTGQIVAKLAGMQRTVTYDHAHTAEWNHGTAAGTVVLAMCAVTDQTASSCVSSMDKYGAVHDANDSGTRHTFTL